jgi:transposase-like protein
VLQPRRDQRAAERFFRRLVHGQGKEPFRIVTDKTQELQCSPTNSVAEGESRHATIRQQSR